jgi:cysteine desulfurase/selenocysteine lyase
MEVDVATGVHQLDVQSIKADFPILGRQVHGTRVVYLDSASSSQKPRQVLDAMDRYYETNNANIHRGTYTMAEESTALYEGARGKLARFIGAPSSSEVVFTKNVTEAMNLVAHSWGRANLGPGDAIVLSEVEHHANLIPWFILQQQLGFEIRFIRLADDYTFDLSQLDRLVDGAKLVGVTAMSNVLGYLPPVREIADVAHAAGALVLLDGAQLTPHSPVDVVALGADFYGVTGHKMLGPTGIGALWARAELLEAMPPFLGGGEMIRDVRLDGFTTNDIPWKFEAGTMPIAEAVGLGAAVDYLSDIGMDAIREHEVSLTAYAIRALKERHGEAITIHGPSEPAMRGGVLSFDYKGIHPHDVAQVLDQSGVCVRAGHHCAKPLMRRLGVAATTRASLYLYNDEADVDVLVDSLSDADMFAL